VISTVFSSKVRESKYRGHCLIWRRSPDDLMERSSLVSESSNGFPS